MGVRGLLKFLRTNPKARVQNRSLAGLAEDKVRETGRAVLVCDFFSILFWLLDCFHVSRVTEGAYKPESFVFGGDYTEYSDRFISLIKALRYVCAEPILFVDGARGSVLRDMNEKMFTYEARERDRFDFVEKCVQFCMYDGRLDPEQIKKWKKYPLIIAQVLLAIRSENVKIVHCFSEADSEMAEYARVHPEVCGILTTDTDMVMMRKCTIIHCKFFDRAEILGLRKPTFNEKPSDIVCDLITPRSLARALMIQEEDLKIISIICGNDYTASYRIYREMDLRYPFISSAAQWIAENPMVPSITQIFFKIPMFKELLSKSPKFYDAVKHTYEAYGEIESFMDMCENCEVERGDIPRHPKVPSHPLSVSPVRDLVQRGIENGDIIRRLLSVVNSGILFRNKFVEGQPSDSREFKCTQDLMFSLRRVTYMLLGIKTVREYGHFTGRSDPLSYSDVHLTYDSSAFLLRVRDMEETSRVLHIIPLIVKANGLRRFDNFQCAPIPAGYSPHIASQLKPLVLCSVLLYACSLADESSTFDDPELATDVFLATCLMSVYGKPPFKVLERPTVDAVNMNTGFACTFHHVYDIASLFGLLGLLPPPGCIYQPAALVAFHQIAATSEETVRTKSRRSREFVEIHTTYTHLVHLRQFLRLKKILHDFYQKCIRSRLDPMDLVCLAQAFYHVLGEYHSSLPELEGRIEELQALVTTEQKSPLKGMAYSH